jgi:hypothetical protein
LNTPGIEQGNIPKNHMLGIDTMKSDFMTLFLNLFHEIRDLACIIPENDILT